MTGYSGTDCSGSSSAFSPGVNNGCAEMPDAFQEIITACSDSGSAPCDNLYYGLFGDASAGYYACNADTQSECELMLSSKATGKCSSETHIGAGCDIRGDPPSRPNYGINLVLDTDAPTASPTTPTPTTSPTASPTTVSPSASPTEADPPPVTIEFTSPGDVSDFDATDRATVKANVASQAGVAQSAVTVTVEAASVKVTVTITTASAAQATSISNTLTASLSSAAAATAVLGVTVSSTPSVATDTGDSGGGGGGGSDGGGGGVGIVLIAAAAGGGGAALVVALVVAYFLCGKKKSGKVAAV